MEMVMSEFNYARYYVSSANLALVAYRAKGGLDGNVTAGMSSNALSASLISAGLQSSAAQDIASNYSVVASTADVAFQGETGLNAVLLRRNGTDQYVLSISGVDVVADATETRPEEGRGGTECGR